MDIVNQLLTPNTWSRPCKDLAKVKALVVHWVENPRTTAMFNRNYFEARKMGHLNYGSAHFIIDPTMTIRCIPETEWAYHVGAEHYTDMALDKLGPYPNNCTIGIELCHEDWEGHFHENTLNQAVELLRILCDRYSLAPMDDIIRHYDVVGKRCPKYFVDHPEEFDLFKGRV